MKLGVKDVVVINPGCNYPINISDDAKKYANLELDFRFNGINHPDQFYYRSDHFHFIKNNIPAIFYFSGVHEDYH